MNREIKDQVFLKMAVELSTLSHCVSHKVGSLFVRDGRILTSGINGTPEGHENCDSIFNPQSFDREAHHEWSNKHEIHAEMNGILHASKHGIALAGSTVYSTLQPCPECIKNLIPSGIVRVVFAKLYDKGDSLTSIAKFYAGSNIPIKHVRIQ